MRALVIPVLILALAGPVACNRSKGVNSKAAIQGAIEEHVKQQSTVVFQNMTVEVDDVTFNGETAVAQVRFRSRQSPDLAVGMKYKLHRVGDAWQVESGSSTNMVGTSPHGNTAAPMPPPTSKPAEPGPLPSH